VPDNIQNNVRDTAGNNSQQVRDRLNPGSISRPSTLPSSRPSIDRGSLNQSFQNRQMGMARQMRQPAQRPMQRPMRR